MRSYHTAPLLGVLILVAGNAAGAAPLAEKYLLDGKLDAGVKALQGRLKQAPTDDQARFGLGVIQVLRSFEHLGSSLYKYGLRTERAFRGAPVPLRQVLPQNPEPEKLAYADVRRLLQTLIDDLTTAEATLAEIKDASVKLPLHVGRIKLDLFGVGKPVSAALVLQQMNGGVPEGQIDKFVISFGRGDVHWLRGYCHYLAAWGEALLAVDGQEIFDCTAHLFFEKVESPHAFLQEEERDLTALGRFDRPLISDIIAFIHLWRFPVNEPERLKASLAHLEATVAQGKQMWKYILARTDDDNVWIPNPRQRGVLGVPVTQEMVDAWLATLDEADLVLKGKKLLPFWRGTRGDRGVNLRRVFTEPRTLDPILWVQGTAATPYLEKGTITQFADPQMIDRINRTFGGWNFIGFAFWFN